MSSTLPRFPMRVVVVQHFGYQRRTHLVMLSFSAHCNGDKILNLINNSQNSCQMSPVCCLSVWIIGFYVPLFSRSHFVNYPQSGTVLFGTLPNSNSKPFYQIAQQVCELLESIVTFSIDFLI